MAGYEEENQNAMNGYEEDEEVEEEVDEEVEEEVEEEEEEEEEEERPAAGGARDGGGGEAVGSGEAGGVQGGRDVPAEPADGSGKIFVGGVAWETTEEKFIKHFQKYGAITDSVIMKDKHTGMPRGFGFVTFSDPSVIDRVLEDEHTIDGRTVEVKRTVPREEMSTKDAPNKTRKIFVGGIPVSLTEGKLKEHFSSYGKVAEHQIMVDHSTGRSRGFGFVTFESEDAVERVMSDGRMHDLGGKQVEIKRAEPKKPGGGDSSSNGRHSHGGGGHRSSYRGGGGGGGGSGGGRSASSSSSGGYGYGADYRSAAAAYYGSAGYGAYGSAGYGAYGRGYGAYGGNPAYGSGFGSGYGGSIYGGPYGAYGAYGGAYGGGAYGGAPGGYGAGGYGGYGGAGSMGGGGNASGRGSGRYHPYGK